MKKIFAGLILTQFFAGVVFAAPVVKDEVILEQGKDSYQSVRHIVIRGTNEEIGKALGDIAQKEYGILRLVQYPDAVYARAADLYMKASAPILRERAQGVAAAYNEKYEDSLSVFSELVYDAGPWGCSSVYYPPAHTTDGTPGGLGRYARRRMSMVVSGSWMRPATAPTVDRVRVHATVDSNSSRHDCSAEVRSAALN